jgi:hypothetical protein
MPNTHTHTHTHTGGGALGVGALVASDDEVGQPLVGDRVHDILQGR